MRGILLQLQQQHRQQLLQLQQRQQRQREQQQQLQLLQQQQLQQIRQQRQLQEEQQIEQQMEHNPLAGNGLQRQEQLLPPSFPPGAFFVPPPGGGRFGGFDGEEGEDSFPAMSPFEQMQQRVLLHQYQQQQQQQQQRTPQQQQQQQQQQEQLQRTLQSLLFPGVVFPPIHSPSPSPLPSHPSASPSLQGSVPVVPSPSSPSSSSSYTSASNGGRSSRSVGIPTLSAYEEEEDDRILYGRSQNDDFQITIPQVEVVNGDDEEVEDSSSMYDQSLMDKVEHLMDLGFSRSDSERALAAASYDLTLATHMLLDSYS